MGRGLMVVRADDGSLIWAATGTGSAMASSLKVQGMDCDVASDVAASDLDGDLVVDRIYVSDTCANLWRVDIVGATTSNWKVSRLATFGSADTGQPIRKFLFRPDVVTLDRDPSKLAILVGSGDREAPFDLAVSNAFYMVIDSV